MTSGPITQKGGALTGGAATDEALATSASLLHPTRSGGTTGLQQFFTPPAAAAFIARHLGTNHKAIDPTAGDGSLLSGFDEDCRFGVELDIDQIRSASRRKHPQPYTHAKADIQHLYPLLRQVGASWPVAVVNPPFGLSWDVPGLGKGSSTLLGFQIARGLLDPDEGRGCLICGSDRFEREIMRDGREKLFYAIIRVERLFPGVDLPCVLAFWSENSPRAGGKPFRAEIEDVAGLTPAVADGLNTASWRCFDSSWGRGSSNLANLLSAAAVEYQRRLGRRLARQEFTIELKGRKLSIRPSAFTLLAMSREGGSTRVNWLRSFHGQTPSYFALNQREWRTLIDLAEPNAITIQPRARAVIEGSIKEMERVAVPLYEVAEAQRLGFLVDQDKITCRRTDPERGLTSGTSYPIACKTAILSEKARREKQTVEGPVAVDVLVERKALEITVTGDGGKSLVFYETRADLEYLLAHFDVPDPGEIATRFPEEVAAIEGALAIIEREIQALEPSFRFRSFQPRDLARLVFKNGGLLAWEQGLGKTLGQGAFVRCLELISELKNDLQAFGLPAVARRFAAAGLEHDAAVRAARGISHLAMPGLPDGCALFIMPQDLAVQSTAEIKRFFGRDLLLVAHLGDALDSAGKPAPRKRPAGRVSAVEVRNAVRARREDLRAQRHGVHLAPRPAIWGATWFESIAHTQRLDPTSLPSHNVANRIVELEPATDRTYAYSEDLDRHVWVPAKPARMGVRRFRSGEMCPACRADLESGWDGRHCHAELLDSVEKVVGDDGKTTEQKVDNAERRRFRGTVRARECGYNHTALRRKPAYAMLGGLFDCVLVDEGTMIQGDTSLTSQAVRGIRARYRVLATGTPLKNYVVQMYWLLWWALRDSSPRFPYGYSGGRERFKEDFAVVETRISGRTDENGKDTHLRDDVPEGPVAKGKLRKASGAQEKMLPEVSNLLRLWKMLCSSVVRRRMDDVGSVVELDGRWTCRACKSTNIAAVHAAGGWTKPAVLECPCGSVADAIVPITYVPTWVPWGLGQRALFQAWLDKNEFARHFLAKHPDSPLAAHPDVIPILAPGIGQLVKLEYADCDPAGDRDLQDPRLTPSKVAAAARNVSSWTPARLRALQLAAEHVAKGDKVLIGSELVAPAPWICDQLKSRGINAVHITESDSDGRARTKAPAKRSAAVKAFRAGEADVFCTSIGAMCLGHNLDVASVAIFVGLPWDFATYDQFLKRVRRLSSQKPVTAYVIIPLDGLTAEKWKRLKDKTASSDLALDGKLSQQTEKPIDRAQVLRELQERGARFDGTEVPEAEVARMWAEWQVGERVVEFTSPPAPEPVPAPAAFTLPRPRAPRRAAAVAQLGFSF